MNLRFACSKCGSANYATLPGQTESVCANCGGVEFLNEEAHPDGYLKKCARCRCTELYRQKDFPQWLGLGFLTVACGLFFFFAIRYEYKIAWSILLGSAAFDGLVYLIVGDVVVCYRCEAQHRGVPARSIDPFELAIAEKYRQERLRREQIQAGRPH